MENFEPKFKLYPNIKLPQPVVIGFDYQVTKIQLFEYIDITVYLFDYRGHTLDIRLLRMENQDYKNWGSDDNYVINWIKNKLSSP